MLPNVLSHSTVLIGEITGYVTQGLLHGRLESRSTRHNVSGESRPNVYVISLLCIYMYRRMFSSAYLS
jgi:hypothetical protein